MPGPEPRTLEQQIEHLHATIAGLEERLRNYQGEGHPDQRTGTAVADAYLQYKEIFDNAAVCLFLIEVTSDGRFKLAGINRAEEQVLGRSNEELSGRFIDDVLAKDLAEHATANYRRCLQAGRAIHFDDQLDLPGGSHWHTNLTPLRNGGGVIDRIIGSCVDMTDLKRTQEQALAKQNLESLGVLAGGIAHDFNNLLGAVLAQAQLAQAELAERSSPEGELKAICDLATRGSEIVRQLLIYAGKESRIREPVDISRTIEGMLELLKISVSKHAILKTDLSQNLPAIRATAAEISQLVMNLVTNASEALGERNGVIRITTRPVKVGQSSRESGGLAEGEHVQLEVSDSGCGIVPDVQARVFDPFFSTKSRGRGLGLAVVHGIVKDLGGAINLVSQPGQGTTFQILLPSVEMPSGVMPGSIAEFGRPARQSPAVVLFVEDEDALRHAISKMLTKRGFSVIESGDGSNALDVIRGQNSIIDVLFLDVTLPGASVREVLDEARRLRPEMKIIITSAYPEEMVGVLVQSTIDHFVRKPYRLHDLEQLIDQSRLL